MQKDHTNTLPLGLLKFQLPKRKSEGLRLYETGIAIKKLSITSKTIQIGQKLHILKRFTIRNLL